MNSPALTLLLLDSFELHMLTLLMYLTFYSVFKVLRPTIFNRRVQICNWLISTMLVAIANLKSEIEDLNYGDKGI